MNVNLDSSAFDPALRGTGEQGHLNEPLSRGENRARPRLIAGCDLPSRVLVGTHHKTGTVWLKSIFLKACDYHGLRFFAGSQACLPSEWDVFLEDHSAFDLDALPGPYRGIHMIRDPRDVIVSGCHYHQVGTEDWLHVRKPELGGKTYQEAILAFASPDDRLLFEMEHAGGSTIRELLQWEYGRPGFLEVKYEELVEDTKLEGFHRLFAFLEFPGSAIPSLLAFAWQHSIFSGSVASPHIRSGRKEQWIEHFKPHHRRRFVELFGDALVGLGYEPDDEWVDTPPPDNGKAPYSVPR